MENKWYIIFNGQQYGPLRKDELKMYGLNPTSQVWSEGMPNWAPAASVPELMSYMDEMAKGSGGYQNVQQDPYQPSSNPGMYGNPQSYQNNPYGGYQQQPPYYAQTSGKSNVAAGVLAILLGALGVQYFYCGKVGGGFICILLTLVTCGLWDIVSIVQGIMMITMSQQDFDRKYVYTTSTFPLF